MPSSPIYLFDFYDPLSGTQEKTCQKQTFSGKRKASNGKKNISFLKQKKLFFLPDARAVNCPKARKIKKNKLVMQAQNEFLTVYNKKKNLINSARQTNYRF